VLAGGASIAAELHAARVLGINLRPLQGLVRHILGTISVEVTPFRNIIVISASLPHPQQLYNCMTFKTHLFSHFLLSVIPTWRLRENFISRNDISVTWCMTMATGIEQDLQKICSFCKANV
jgi:hypothetical protein